MPTLRSFIYPSIYYFPDILLGPIAWLAQEPDHLLGRIFLLCLDVSFPSRLLGIASLYSNSVFEDNLDFFFPLGDSGFFV